MTLTSKRARRLFLTAAIMFTMLSPIGAARAQDDVILHAFTGGADGLFPYGGLIADKEGNVFGTTLGGGDACHDGGCGTVFQIAPDDTETILYAFGNGKKFYLGPLAGLVADKDGNLYGTTVGGGNFNAYHCGNSGCGTVFELAPDGTETTLYAFEGKSDGSEPYAGLIRDKAGNLYGTTLFGGNANCHAGCGTVFRIAPDGTETQLYAFQGGNDGSSPYAGLIADQAGNLYGTTSGADGGNNAPGPGTIFRIAPDGTETVLHVFGPKPDGAHPSSALIADGSGNFYGTTAEGGSAGFGTVFKLAPDGTETVLYSFKGGSDGENPAGGVVADKAGNLYGTTAAGGANAEGTVFKVAPGGKEKVLHVFTGGSDGLEPYAGLILGKGGELYGTTLYGGGGTGCGEDGCGTVFEIKK